MPSEQGRYWMLTIPVADWLLPIELPAHIVWMKGQQELGKQCTEKNPNGYHHWQFVVCYRKKVRPARLKEDFGSTAHFELTKSKAANEYICKDDTAVSDTRFELGKLPIKRNCSDDWQDIWDNAKRGCLDEVPVDIRIRSYMTLKRIAADHMVPQPMEREVFVYWGKTGTGKSKRAWTEAGFAAYPKDPRTKFWDGYQGHQHVVMDEFDGAIDICHLLRWFDRYPVCVEVKGSSVVLNATKIWITSNVDPRCWFPTAKPEQVLALMRRLRVTEYPFDVNHSLFIAE